MPLIPGTSPLTLLFWNIAAVAVVAGLFGVFWILIRRTRRGTPALDAALAFAVLVCAETVVLNGLSIFHLVGRGGILAAHVALVAVVSGCLGASRRKRGPLSRRLPLARTWWLTVGVLVPLVLASAVRYAPNGGDAMTYHLARVAHWIENSSVAPYPSLILRQTVMMPGSEYIITALVAVAGSDHLSALPQFVAWLIVAAAAPSLARLWGTPARWSWLAVPVVAAAPMIVLQASSVQNDLVAAVTAVAVVASSMPLLHRGRAPKSGAVILFGFACAAAGLVKATAVIAAVPFAVVAAVSLVKSGAVKSRMPALLFAFAALVLLVVPEAVTRETLPRTNNKTYVYSASDSWFDRIANSAYATAHHFSVPFVVKKPTDFGPKVINMPTRPHEDYVGNPLQFVLIATLLGFVLFRWPRLTRRSRLAAVCWIAGWVAFHATLKDNAHLSRLQVPWFVLLPVLGGALRGLRTESARARLVFAAVSVIVVLNGVWIAAHNELRPPLVRTVGPRESHYFRTESVALNQQQEALRIAQQAGCERIALFMGESGYDYPITRAAMAAGMATRHLFSDDGWACAIYVERLSWSTWGLPAPRVALKGSAWMVAATGHGGPFVFVRRGARDIRPR